MVGKNAARRRNSGSNRSFDLLDKKSRRYLAQNEERRLSVNVARVAYVKDFQRSLSRNPRDSLHKN